MSFARLFRSSKFAALDPLGRQVLTTPEHLMQKGEWGLKHTMSRNLKSPFVVVKQHDDADGVVHYHGAFELVAAVERWKEIVPLPTKPHPLPTLLEESFVAPQKQKMTEEVEQLFDEAEKLRTTWSPVHLAKATKEEYQEVLKRAWETRKTFKKLVAENIWQPRQWSQFLKIVTPYQAQLWGEKEQYVHGPVYRTRDPSEPLTTVKGRIVNSLGNSNGFAVAIGGFIAYLPVAHATITFTENNRRNLFDFYIVDAKVTAEGAPEIIVSMIHPDEINSTRFSGFNPSFNPKSPLSQSLPFTSRVKLADKAYGNARSSNRSEVKRVNLTSKNKPMSYQNMVNKLKDK